MVRPTSGTFRCCFAWKLISALCWLGDRPSPAQMPEAKTQFIVGVYDYAEVPGDILVHAEQEAAEIFRRAGIRLQWVDCPVSRQQVEKLRSSCAQAEASGAHFLKILPQSMTARHSGSLHSFGYAVPPHFAYLFADRAQALAKHGQYLLYVIMGLVIAHELGHLILGEEMHSAAGIMREDLDLKDLRRAEEGILLTFSTAQAQRMRVRLQEESLGH